MALSSEALHKVYYTMTTIRQFEERMIKEFMAGNIPGFVHTYDGQEAVGVGICTHLTDEDIIGSTHRGHGHCIAKGCDIEAMILEIMGKQGGLCNGKGGSMHIADFDRGMLGANAIVGGGPPLCNGAALSAKTLGTKNIAVSFSGDGSSNQGTVMEALNLAGVLDLPHIFIFENNHLAEGTGDEYAVSGDIANRVASFDIPAVKVDGLDFFAVYDAMEKAVEHTRSGKGPYAIEADVIRFDGHFIGDPQAYRGEGELDDLRANKDCLKIFRKRVTSEGLMTDDELDMLDAQAGDAIEQGVQRGLAAPQPAVEELYTDVHVSY
ncbi:acetoin:2,6-dichlorophenolindophenol oxidoreductase alpha subunit [Luminiphilus syltensis NOR5-1B]|uniref:Acetoin:2,6-dichlorophenolindophenol oxidoreductase alpha subunit n=1 Tax=Luminiphilus syltensis NOR5-1B TaxID=565045 RepID=B8KSP7_9GAMM|nr:thiamine pyrophosphate-dependent dehydrogenase E1 component subunit alpha [Luminiphilus syltensis]EED35084.1 acetoin:2,6-dichlorophenolindophenol oxidoreductase alpha subunit [Luminiphilus syltensis NOR5-1B]